MIPYPLSGLCCHCVGNDEIRSYLSTAPGGANAQPMMLHKDGTVAAGVGRSIACRSLREHGRLGNGSRNKNGHLRRNARLPCDGAPDTDRTCDLSLRTTMAFATTFMFVVWTIPWPWAGACTLALRPEPSSLYTFRPASRKPAWLGIASSRAVAGTMRCQGSPNLTPFTRRLSASGAQSV